MRLSKRTQYITYGNGIEIITFTLESDKIEAFLENMYPDDMYRKVGEKDYWDIKVVNNETKEAVAYYVFINCLD